ncbi:peptidoglycan DD-metalloendopeptidase family protein [Reichenbachiella carrageenanivorans]|uniref:Peptidoglycan DD-metalloendopeptidase family protein n=1 Tax=Reichenbachiella carrageenanivorans TaxID=2979869 RepID=A0ABY6D203_9BACT|nr:peptidoglycan DD-metalloendopeptidase family protein [Reichenbachiella carrageenanivorans]UXX80186.1 peptidoglycan DD-metalloendopeptidase family protein [Reichenbachiella carrageenanivorans]
MQFLKKWGWGIVLFAGIVPAVIYFSFLYEPIPAKELVEVPGELEDTVQAYIPKKYFGIIVDSLQIDEGTIKRNQNLSDLLQPYNVPYEKIHSVARQSKEVFDVRKIVSGKPYSMIYKGDSIKEATHFIYQPSAIDFVVIDFQDSVRMYQGTKEIELKETEMSGEIFTSLYVDMLASGGHADLVNKLVDVFAWQVDFFGIQRGDNYRLIYDEQYVDGELVGIGEIKAAYFEHVGSPYFGFRFEQDSSTCDYFDETGQSLRKEFLKAPLSFTRISSRYTGRRYHPVQKRYKAHLGTDYAAPVGTPIRAVADGKIIAAQYHRFNGNYVKIQHNGNIATQYLHMSKIASGVRTGVKIKRGETIGFVGSTGLASGPHLCYRFWKNGKQVDALKVELPPSEPILPENMATFDSLRQIWQQRLAEMYLPQDAADSVVYASLGY